MHDPERYKKMLRRQKWGLIGVIVASFVASALIALYGITLWQIHEVVTQVHTTVVAHNDELKGIQHLLRSSAANHTDTIGAIQKICDRLAIRGCVPHP